MRRSIAILTIATSVVFGTAACGDDDGGGDDAIIDRLVEELDAPRDEAECVVAALGDDAAAFADIASSGAEPDPELEGAIVAALIECGLE